MLKSIFWIYAASGDLLRAASFDNLESFEQSWNYIVLLISGMATQKTQSLEHVTVLLLND
jgi:hypothetical protein